MTVRTELNTLQARGLVQVANLEPELEYTFRHALVQDAAYGSLLKQDRRLLHRRAADALRALYPERARELASVFAMHLEQAGDLAAAAEQLVVAGEHALERFANQEAIGFFRRALTLLGPDDPRVELPLRAAVGVARAAWGFAGPDQLIADLERTLARAPNADRGLVGDAYFWIAFLRGKRGENPDTSPALREALARAAEIGKTSGDPAARAMPHAFMGAFMALVGHLRAGAETMSQALDELQGSADPRSTAMLANFLAGTQARLGQFDEAERTLALSEKLAQSGDEIARLDAALTRAVLRIERGEIDDGEALAFQCAVKSEDLGAVACMVGANLTLGTARLAREDVIGARPPVERGHELALVANLAPMRTLLEGMLGTIKARLGDLPAGAAGWDEALRSARTMNDRTAEAVTLWLRARAYPSQPDPSWSLALGDFDAAAALFEAMEARPSLARVLRDRAAALRALGRPGEADASTKRANELAKELGLRDFAPA